MVICILGFLSSPINVCKYAEGRDYDLVTDNVVTILVNACHIPFPVLVGDT